MTTSSESSASVSSDHEVRRVKRITEKYDDDFLSKPYKKRVRNVQSIFEVERSKNFEIKSYYLL